MNALTLPQKLVYKVRKCIFHTSRHISVFIGSYSRLSVLPYRWCRLSLWCNHVQQKSLWPGPGQHVNCAVGGVFMTAGAAPGVPPEGLRHFSLHEGARVAIALVKVDG